MKKLFLLTSILFFSISSAQNEGYRLKTNLYESILEYSLKASDINAIANGIEKVGFTVVSSNVISDDGTYITTQFLIGDDEHILISKSRNFGDTQKIIFLHQTNIFNFIIHYKSRPYPRSILQKNIVSIICLHIFKQFICKKI